MYYCYFINHNYFIGKTTKGLKMKSYDIAIKMMDRVFGDMDKDFTVWEYRQEIKELLRCAKFVSHINSHFQEEHPDWDVECKICGKKLNDC